MKQIFQFSRKAFIAVLLPALIFTACKKTLEEESAPEFSKETVGTTTAVPGSKDYCKPDENRVSSINSPIAAKVVAELETVYNTDHVSAGVGGMRNVGTGTIVLGGVSGTVTKAYLYWHGVTDNTSSTGNAITLNGNAVNGTAIGVSNNNCWLYNNSQAYRADVTSLVAANGNYAVAGFGDLTNRNNLNPNGASLVVFFDDGNIANNRDVVIFDGNDSNIGFAGIIGNTDAPADASGWNATLSGITYTSGTANLQLHVADGQSGVSFVDAQININATQLEAAGQIFSGASVPGPTVISPGPNGLGNLWDIKTWNITSFLTPGDNSLNLTTGTAGDCLGLIVALIDLPVIKAEIDVKPGSCPNSVNVNNNGNIPVAILGTAGFDVTKVDVSTVKLNGVSHLGNWILADVSRPYNAALDGCNSCTIAGPDGIMDLVFHFDQKMVAATLGSVNNNACINVTLTGSLLTSYGGYTLMGQDIIRIVKKK